MKESPNWPYLAGLFDGEGCVHIADFKWRMKEPDRIQQIYRLDMHITTTSENLVHWLVREVGGKYYKIAMKGNWKDAYRWQLSGNKNKERFFKGILPYLVIKRENAKIALDYLALAGTVCPEKRKELAGMSRILNRRGKSVETNTLNAKKAKRESDLIREYESEPVVIQDSPTNVFQRS